MRLGRMTWVAVLCVAVMAAGGCASSPGKEIPLRSCADLDTKAPRIAIDYDAHWFTQQTENPAVLPALETYIDRVFSDSGLFSTFNRGSTQKKHLSIVVRNEGNMAAAQASGFICGLTLCLVPAVARDNYVLEADVKEGGKTLKHYVYRDHVTTTIWAFLAFVPADQRPEPVVKKVIENMLLNMLYDMQKDGMLH